jgi:pimeloyl-ACP methyl ester carboxylesterase
MKAIEKWEAAGRRAILAGHDIFFVDVPARREEAEPVLILHGFPTSSFDWVRAIPVIAESRRVVALDYLGYGLSAKPLDHAYSLFEQADIVTALAENLGLDRVALVTHDVGDSVGGEILARSLDGSLPFEITRRVLTNGSIYMDLVQLSPGQLLLLSLPDEPLPPELINEELMRGALAATFSPSHQPSAEELDAQWALISRNDGHRLGARLIRYIEERRVHEPRWTGSIENHPSPLTIVWGALDPIAVVAMAERVASKAPDAKLIRLEDAGHYPMIEVPDRFNDALVAALA